MNNKFTKEICDKLQYYVYRLIDPRNGETFYVGKGKDNRVFAHASGQIKEDGTTEKLKRIRSIQLAGFEVAHVIHRHGMDKSTAFHVEAALIEAYPGLSNIAGGHGNSGFGVMHAEEIINKYQAEIADIPHRALLISINRSALDDSIYEATMFAWRLNPKMARSAEVILSTVQGIIVGVFLAEEWLPATKENFPGKESIEGRYGFIGKEAPLEIQKQYLHKRVDEKFRGQGVANPIKYSWNLVEKPKKD